MISPSSPQIEVVTFGSSFEFRSRAAFREDVVATGAKPYKIVGSYRFEQPVRCGVKDCLQMHDHGYLVLVADGIETNSGWDCGLDHFGVEFVSMRKDYDRAEREYPYRAPLRQLLVDADKWRERLHALQKQRHGGDWLLQNLRQFSKLYPAAVATALQRHAKRGEVQVFEASPRASANLQIVGAERAATTTQTRHSRTLAGTLRGLGIFGVDTHSWPMFELEIELNEFLRVYTENMAFDQVLRWHKWSETLDARLEDFQHLINEGRRFFTRSNLALVPLAIEDESLREQLSWIVWGGGPVEDNARQPRPVAPPPKVGSLQKILKRLIGPPA